MMAFFLYRCMLRVVMGKEVRKLDNLEELEAVASKVICVEIS